MKRSRPRTRLGPGDRAPRAMNSLAGASCCRRGFTRPSHPFAARRLAPAPPAAAALLREAGPAVLVRARDEGWDADVAGRCGRSTGIGHAENLVLIGPSGTGASLFAEAIAHAAIDRDLRVSWFTPRSTARGGAGRQHLDDLSPPEYKGFLS
jgi:hypothetical protein